MLIKKMDKHYDIEKIILEWNNIYRLNHWHNNNQIAIQHSGEVSYTDGCGYWSGQEENDYKYINPIFEGTIFEKIIKEFNGYNARIMLMKPKSVYSIHKDSSIRMHLAILTNLSSYFVFPEDNHVEHIPADGHIYTVDTTKKHTVFNSDLKSDDGKLLVPSNRIHMVFSV